VFVQELAPPILVGMHPSWATFEAEINTVMTSLSTWYIDIVDILKSVMLTLIT
jgi:hypothetical protein